MRVWQRVVAAWMLLVSARGQEPNTWILLNGSALRGEIAEVRADGVEVRSGASTRVYPWFAFAPGTRYRFDPLYRANLAAAQQGLAVARWPHPPDGEYTARPRPLDTPRPDAAPVSIAPLSFAAFPAISAKSRGSLVALDPRAGANALTWGLRYGPEESEAVYFIFESAGEDGLPPAMHMWTSADKRPERVRASRRADGEEARAVFREHQFRAMREGVEVVYHVSPSASTRAPGSFLLTAEIELKKGGVASSFALVGAPPGVLSGDGNVAARDILAPPSLAMALDTIGDKPVFAGAVRMGRLRLIPRDGMDRAISVTIADEQGATALAAEVPFTGNMPTDKHSFVVPLEGLRAGRKYQLNARIGLGPFLGELSYQEFFVLK